MSPAAHPRVDAIAGEARVAIEQAESSADLEALRVRFLGRQGELTQLLRSLGSLPADERPVVGAAANEAKRTLEALLESRLADTAERERRQQRAQARLDLTLPGRRPPLGGIHPLSRVRDEIVSIFAGLGFSRRRGPADRDRLAQVRGARDPEGSSRARHAGHVLRVGARSCCARTRARCRSARC